MGQIIIIMIDCQQRNRVANHSEALAEFVEDASFVEHLAAISILVIVGDAKPQLAW